MAERQFRETIVLTGEVYWARVLKPDAEGVYSLEMTATEEIIEMAERLGLKVYTSKDGSRRFIKMKRNAVSKEGNPVKAPRIVDAQLQPQTKLIGNGSTVNAEFFVYDWVNPKTKQKGRGAYLVALQVKNLVPYEAAERLGKFTTAEAPEDSGEIANEGNKFSNEA